MAERVVDYSLGEVVRKRRRIHSVLKTDVSYIPLSAVANGEPICPWIANRTWRESSFHRSTCHLDHAFRFCTNRFSPNVQQVLQVN
jgi:hypothetical protein